MSGVGSSASRLCGLFGCEFWPVKSFLGPVLDRELRVRWLKVEVMLTLSRCSNKFTVETTEWEGVWDR
jgi:hypothetical protein